MAEIIDQIVKISIQDAISSVTTVDVNTLAIVGLATTSTPVAGEIASAPLDFFVYRFPHVFFG